MADPKTAAAAAQAKGTKAESGYQQSKKLEAALWADMEPNRSTWALIGEHIGPWRNSCIAAESAGDATRRSNKIINSHASLAADAFVAGMMAGNAAPSQIWMKVTTRNRKLAESDEAKRFLQELTDALFEDCANSNVYPSLALGWWDQGNYGTEAMLTIKDERDPVRCYVFPIGTYSIGQDYRGVPDKFCRRFTMTAEQMRDRFGEDKLSAQVKAALSNAQTAQQRFEVSHLIAPNANYHANASVAKYRKWHECYFERGRAGEYGDGQYLDESGYGSFPVIVARWKSAGPHTPWGVGLTIQALGDIAQLQAITMDEANAIEFGVNPPMQGPGSLQGAFLNRKPGGYNSVDVTQGLAEIKPLIPNTLRLDHTQLLIQRIETRIDKVYKVDLWRQFTGPVDRLPKTAYLAQKMFQEKTANLLPDIEQQTREFLAPLIARLIQIRIETGKLLPPGSEVPEGNTDIMVVPDVLADAELTFEFESPLVQAQRAAQTGNTEAFLDRWMAIAGALPQVADQILNKLDIYAAIDESADGYSVPPKLIRDAAEVAEMDEAQAEAMNAQRMAQNVPGAAKAVSDLGNTPAGAGSVLDQMAGAVA